ncbi:helix-turn-helix domain-containing protein [Streptomyces sp. NPDC001834]|uniref:helix-turn-helix domain-containing protein n=1 Tax=Streptomyces sp. NPDC001834 TaxID=3364616 RepID=UPI003697942E
MKRNSTTTFRHIATSGIARIRLEPINRLAEAARVRRKSIIQIEAGRVAAKISTLHGIAHALGMPLPELVAAVCA